MDLFGLKKTKAPEDEPPSAAPAPAPDAAPRGSHRLWAFLLILDSVFVVVFAGAVAAKVYQHWRAPSAAAPARRRPVKVAVKPVETPAADASSTAPAATPPPAPAPEPPQASAKLETPSHGMRPPKPSLLSDAPKPRETPKLAGTGQAPAKPVAAAVDGARPRAKPIAFRVRATTAKSVALVGAFIVRGGRLEMKRDADGIWEAEVYLHPGQYRYFFAVDKKKILDPENPRSERGSSLLTVP